MEFIRKVLIVRDSLSSQIQQHNQSVRFAYAFPFEPLVQWPKYSHLTELQVDKAAWILGTLMQPFILSLLLNVFVTIICFWVCVFTDDWSMVDRYWSILPPVVVLLTAISSNHVNGRLIIMSVLILIWGIRLTINFARKGGYKLSHGEDYRWHHVRNMVGDNVVVRMLFLFFFVAVYQTLLLNLISSVPVYHVFLFPERARLNWNDLWITALWLMLFIGEVVADEQMWKFQQAKKKHRSGKLPKGMKGFLDQGLFYFTRHPNYFCETSMWTIFSLFAWNASGQLFSIASVGWILLDLLFVGSIQLTEKISKSKYPEYEDYCKTTSGFFPWFKKSVRRD